MSDAAATMIANLHKTSGRSLEEWVDRVHETGLDKHGQIVTHLKSEYGLGHGYANLIALTALRAGQEAASESDLVERQYAGKDALRPIYQAILARVSQFGDDVEVAPKKASVNLRRAKQFALVTPATRTRVDLGINLPGTAPTPRLRAIGGMCTHTVALTSIDDLDDEVVNWLRLAYQTSATIARKSG